MITGHAPGASPAGPLGAAAPPGPGRHAKTNGRPRFMDRVLVTGGAGFIGSHLVESLLDSGADVLVVDDFRLGKCEHLGDGSQAGRLTVIEGDIRSAGDLRPVADFAP